MFWKTITTSRLEVPKVLPSDCRTSTQISKKMSWRDFLQFFAKTVKDKADLWVLLLIKFTAFSACLWRMGGGVFKKTCFLYWKWSIFTWDPRDCVTLPAWFGTRFYAPLFYSVMYHLMVTPPTSRRKIKIAVLDQSACPSYPVSNLW